MAIDPAGVREILVSGDLALLIGEFESLQLECKRQPYQLQFDGQKVELAKDVTALANAEGGVILIGYSTAKDTTHGEDRIDACRPFGRELLDVTQYTHAIQDWTWPALPSIEVLWFPSSSEPQKGVGAIFVPKAIDSEKPVLVAKTVIDTDRRVEIIFGYCERGKSKVSHYNVQRLQSLLRDGNRLDQEIREGLQSLHSALENLRVAHPPEPHPTRNPDVLIQRLNEALEAVGLAESPAYSLAAAPRRSIDLHQIFESRNTRLVQLLEAPPELRQPGFDITSGDRSRIIEGRLRRVSVDGYKLLELHRDGAIIFIAQGDQDGLCWGSKSRQASALVNQLYLLETIYVFCKLAYQAYEGQLQEGEDIDFYLHIMRLTIGSGFANLEPGPLGDYRSHARHQAPADSSNFSVTVQFGRDSAARAAFLLAARVYAWFGFDEESIPYSVVVDDKRILSEELLANVR